MPFVTRAEWGARPPKNTGNQISAHPKGVAVHWEGPKVGSRPHDECAALVRGIQKFHMDTRGWADVAYSYMACEHGYVFEGRGVGKGSAANGTTQANLDWYAVCGLVGEGDAVPDALLSGICDAIDICRRGGAGSAICRHGDLFQTSCCGSLSGWVRAGAQRPAGAVAHKGSDAPTPAAPKPVVKAPAVPAFPGTVQLGSTGNAVRLVQQRLKDRGWRITVDGVFGTGTAQVVRAFQVDKHLAADGIAGPATWSALWSTPITK